MVACRRDVGGRCIKARGLPGLSQQPGAVTKPLELGRDAPKTGARRPGTEGCALRDSQQGTHGPDSDTRKPRRIVPAAGLLYRLHQDTILKLSKTTPPLGSSR